MSGASQEWRTPGIGPGGVAGKQAGSAVGRRSINRAGSPRLLGIFTGQGAQRADMAQPWLSHPTTAALFTAASKILGYDLAEACRYESALADTRVAQPAIFMCDLAAYRVLAETGLSPVAVAGHSLGEFAALVAAGVFEFAPALQLVRDRAEAMADAAAKQPGAMAAVLGPGAQEHADAAVRAAGAVGTVVVANFNGPWQVVLSGSVDAVSQAERVVRDRGGRCSRLPVAGAFHSPLMAAAAARVADAISRLDWSVPAMPVIPNVTGEPTQDPSVLAECLRRHLLSPVRWDQTMRSLARLEVTRIVECGPARILGSLVHQALPQIETALVRSPDGAAQHLVPAGVA